MNFKSMIEALPVPVLFAFILFPAFPKYETAVVICAAFAYVGFCKWVDDKRSDEVAKLREEMKALSSKVETIQLSKALHR